MDKHTDGHGARASTLWGKGPNGGSRDSTTWGRRGGSSVVAAIVGALALLVPVSGAAAAGVGTYVAPGLLAKADKTPTKTLHVIVQSIGGEPAAESAAKGVGGTLKKRLDLVGGVAVDLPAGQVKTLAMDRQHFRSLLREHHDLAEGVIRFLAGKVAGRESREDD